MTKDQLIAKMAEAAGPNVSKASMSRALDAMWEGITESLLQGEKFSQRGFGTFSLVQTKPKKGRNFATGKDNLIPAQNRCKFTQAEALKAKLNPHLENQ